MAQKSVHVHKYQRLNIGKPPGEYFVMKCMDPSCSHYIAADLALGRNCVCWRCGDIFVLTKNDLSFRRPHCRKCTRWRPKEGDVMIERKA